MRFGVLFSTWVAVAMLQPGCGGSDRGCVELCEELRPRLLDTLPDLAEDDITCTEAPWTKAHTCDACLQILNDLYTVAVVDEEQTCRDHGLD